MKLAFTDKVPQRPIGRQGLTVSAQGLGTMGMTAFCELVVNSRPMPPVLMPSVCLRSAVFAEAVSAAWHLHHRSFKSLFC